MFVVTTDGKASCSCADLNGSWSTALDTHEKAPVLSMIGEAGNHGVTNRLLLVLYITDTAHDVRFHEVISQQIIA